MSRAPRCPSFLRVGVIAFLTLLGCESPMNLAGDGDAATGSGDAAAGDAALGDTQTGDLDPGGDMDVDLCPRLPPPDDYVRVVVVSHPYATDFSQPTLWEVWELATDGTLTNTGVTFNMGRSTGGVIAFTPDGEIGLVAQDMGSLGVFRLPASGPPEVIYTEYKGSLYPFYASDVIVGPTGRHAYVVDDETRGINGGGIYALRIECDGTLTELGHVAPANTPGALRFLPGRTDRAVIAADDVLSSPADNDLHLLSWGSPPAVLSSVSAMGVLAPTISALAVTTDGRYVLMGDNSELNGVANGVGVVEVASDVLYPVTVLDYIDAPGNEDPVGIVVSPYNNAALVIDGYANGVWVLDYDSTDMVTPFVDLGEATYAIGQASPQLPCCAVVIERGILTGHILVAENVGIRQMQFEPAGGVTDIGLIAGTVPIVRIVGAIGVQP